jgi:hypothetical protein
MEFALRLLLQFLVHVLGRIIEILAADEIEEVRRWYRKFRGR